jgi:hypothetical protein
VLQGPGGGCGDDAYLLVVHLEFPDDFDGHLAVLVFRIPSAVDVAEGAVTHLLDQSPPLEARVLGQLRPVLALLGDDALDDGRVVLLATLILLGQWSAGVVSLRRGAVLAGARLTGGRNGYLAVDGRAAGGRLGVGGLGLLAMADEVLDILYGAHDDCGPGNAGIEGREGKGGERHGRDDAGG